ncbi:hypothetical protein MRX96_031106 [Rhipicephalus microplus]
MAAVRCILRTALQHPCYLKHGVLKPLQQCTVSSRCFSFSPSSNSERRFSEKHEWVVMDGDIGTVGISQHAQEALGDVVYVQPPDIGTVLTQHGKVTEVNKALEDKPALVNSDCYNEGWIFKLKVKNADELKSLMDGKGL